jgi:hypothetical protein
MVFRSGVIELIDQGVITKARISATNSISARRLETQIMKWIEGSKAVLRALEMPPPAIICMSLVDVAGMSLFLGMSQGAPPAGLELHPFDGTTIKLPIGFLESWDMSTATALRLPFDGLWNAIGMPRCNHFDANGNWCEQDD